VELALEVVVGDPNDLEVLVVEEILQKLERGLIAHEVEVIELGLDRPLQHQIPQRSCGDRPPARVTRSDGRRGSTEAQGAVKARHGRNAGTPADAHTSRSSPSPPSPAPRPPGPRPSADMRGRTCAEVRRARGGARRARRPAPAPAQRCGAAGKNAETATADSASTDSTPTVRRPQRIVSLQVFPLG